MDKNRLVSFLLKANAAGYSSGDSKDWIKNIDGSTTIRYLDGEFTMDDSFYGGEPYGGRIIVFYKDKPCWMMVYYGWVSESQNLDPVYHFLQNALKNMPEEAPFRGPREFKEGRLSYENKWQGSIERYSGNEQIFEGDSIIYEASYMGGIVDTRS